MKPEQQRIAIAEACGWQFIPEYCHGKDQPPEFTTVTPDGRHLCGYYPDYLNDLNAMHEAENSLSHIEQCQFAEQLFRVMIGEHGVSEFMKIYATAAQRAEAFLRTIGKWVSE